MASKRKNDCQSEAKVKIKKIVAWQPDWLRDPSFKDWLEKHPNEPQTAICKYCNCNIKFTRKSNLDRHIDTDSHKWSVEQAKNSGAFVTVNVEGPSFLDRVHREEMRTAQFIAENNIAIQLVDPLVPFMQKSVDDVQAVKGMKMKRTKCGGLIKNVLYPQQFEEIKTILNDTYFSVLVDESTDISNKKILCISVQYFHRESGSVVQHLLQLIELNALRGSAKDIFDEFKNFFVKSKINMGNIVALACDNASVMVGKHGGFQKFLRECSPHLIVLNCVCHSSALIAKSSFRKLPKELDELLRGVSTYINKSPKRMAELHEFLVKFEVPTTKIPKVSGTRWLESYYCYDSMLKKWTGVLEFFRIRCFEEEQKKLCKSAGVEDFDDSDNENCNIHSNEIAIVDDNSRIQSVENQTSQSSKSKESMSTAQKLFSLLNDDSIKAYCFFMKYTLDYFNKFNALFQTKGLMIHKLLKAIQRIISQMSMNFLKYETISQASSREFSILENVRPLDEINLGADCEEILLKMSTENAQVIRRKCLDYYVTALHEMRNRLLENYDLLTHVSFVEPANALNRANRRNVSIFAEFWSTKFTFIEKDLLYQEWINLAGYFDDDNKLLELGVEEFWNKVLQTKQEVGDELIFPTLKKLIEAVFSLPHSNAEPERTFSDVNEIKDAKTNKTGTSLLNARCFLRSVGQALGKNCLTFEATARHFELFQSHNLYS